MKTRAAADNCAVVCVASITVDFREVFEQTLNKVERMWTVGMTCELDALEGGRNVFFYLFDFLCHANLYCAARGHGSRGSGKTFPPDLAVQTMQSGFDLLAALNL